MAEAVPQGFTDAAALRRQNRATVEKYPADTTGPARLHRHELFVEHGGAGIAVASRPSPGPR
jgi:hypothetical protein